MASHIRHRSALLATSIAAIMVPILSACGSDGSTASFEAPKNDATVAGGVVVSMNAEGIIIEPAGEVNEGAGHFHVIADAGCEKPGTAIVSDVDHVHFGKAQSDGVIYLTPGTHELCLQVGDGTHAALNVTDTVTVKVGINDQTEWCAVVKELNELLDGIDGEELEFSAVQAGYAKAQRLIAQLDEGLKLIDPAARDDVGVLVEWVGGFTEVILGVSDESAAEAAMAPYWESDTSPSEAGETWIRDACGVDVSG